MAVQTRRQSETKPLKRRSKTKHDESSSCDSSDEGGNGYAFKSLPPSPLRQGLSGKETKRDAALTKVSDNATTATTSSTTVASSSRCATQQNANTKTSKSLSDYCCSLSTSELDFSKNATAGSNNNTNNNGECYTSVSSMTSENVESEYDFEISDKGYSFLMFRLSYLFVTLVVMLADGLQGT